MYIFFFKFFSHFSSVQFSSFQSLSRVRLFATPWITAHQASLTITNSQSSLRLTSIESVMPSSHLILCPLLLLLPPIPPSIKVFSNESTLCMRWPKYCSFSFSIIPSKEIPGLISFRMDWLDLLAVQGTLKSLLQHVLSTPHSPPPTVPKILLLTSVRPLGFHLAGIPTQLFYAETLRYLRRTSLQKVQFSIIIEKLPM